jgi:hypothetical protein
MISLGEFLSKLPGEPNITGSYYTQVIQTVFREPSKMYEDKRGALMGG